MKQDHVQFHFMCKLHVGPKGMQSYYTVYSCISISIERLFLLVQRKTRKARDICQNYIQIGCLEKLLYSYSHPQEGMNENRVVISADEKRLQKCEMQLISFCSRPDCNLNQVLSLNTVMLVPCWKLFMAGPQYRVQKNSRNSYIQSFCFPSTCLLQTNKCRSQRTVVTNLKYLTSIEPLYLQKI